MRSQTNEFKPQDGYRPIRDYALIGNLRTTALVSSEGSIDWCCCPHVDSPAIFCRLLDKDKGGFFQIRPGGHYASQRSYIDSTNVLTTTFTTDEGQFRLTDFMPVVQTKSDKRTDVKQNACILRLIEGLSGVSQTEIIFRPSFDYARVSPVFQPFPGGLVAKGQDESLRIQCPVTLHPFGADGFQGQRRIKAGERFWMALTYQSDAKSAIEPLSNSDFERALEETIHYWQAWSARETYDGPYENLVRRSALALKLLTFEPTGALVAAPTTSLPEEIGGVRNWDYRFTWLRDSSLVLYALQSIGHHEEAMRFFEWLEGLCLECPGDPHIMYSIYGKPVLREETLGHLQGYRSSRPVRIGNAAASQNQIDVYGEVLDAAHLCYVSMRPPRPGLWRVLRFFADRAAERWQEPGHGIWEIRTAPRHFLHSKLFCWVALDRAVRLAEKSGLDGDLRRWRQVRDEIRTAILTHGYNNEAGAFTQAFGTTDLDASVLMIPLIGFLPPHDPRVRSTIKAIQEKLTSGGLVYRYLTEDGLPGQEATFALCTFWLVSNLAMDGRIDEARTLFERVARYANDVGLMSEEINPTNGELLGNFPQGFTHLALIRSALALAEAERSASGRYFGSQKEVAL